MGYEAAIQTAHVGELDAAKSSSNGRRIRALFLTALLVGVACRFWELGSRSLWLDESYSAWFSNLDWRDLWVNSPGYETHPPFYYSLLKLWRELGGDDAAALRSLSATASLAAIPLTLLSALALGKLAPPRQPFVLLSAATGLLAASPRLILIAQDARPYALLLAAYALALTCWLRLTLSFSRDGDDGRWADWLGLGIGTLLVLWLHFLGILHAAALFGALMLTMIPTASRQRWLRLAVTVAAVLLSYLPCLVMLVARSGDWSSGWLPWEPARWPGAMLDLYGLYQLDEVWTPFSARILFAILIFSGLRALWRRNERSLASALGLLILFPPVAAALISQLGHPVFLPRTLVAVLAPAYLAAAYGLATIRARDAFILGGALALILAINLAETLRRPSLEPWDEVAASVESNMKPGDAIWVYPNDTALPLRHALIRAMPITPVPAPFPALNAKGDRPAGSPAVVAIDEAAAREFARAQEPRSRGTIWVVIRNPGLFDPEGEVARGLAQGRRLGPVRRWGDIDLMALQPR